MSVTDFKPGDGWNEYQRLVLAELERHNKMIEGIMAKLNDIFLSLALMKQENGKISQLEYRVDELAAKLSAKDQGLDERLEKIEQGDMIDRAIKKHRVILWSAAVTILTAIVIPIVKIVFFPGA